MNLDRARKFVQSREIETSSLLRSLVETNSFTANGRGVRRVGELVEAAFRPLGFESKRVRSKVPGCGDHLVLTRRGKSGRGLALVSHLDTVFPSELEAEHDFRWREDGERIYGPGTCDIKGGTVVMHEALVGLAETAPSVFEAWDWTLLFDATEETGSEDFPALAERSIGKATAACLVYEAGYPTPAGSTIVRSRKGSGRFVFRFFGRAGHSGNRHREGASAVVEMADKILKLAALTDYARGVTTNPIVTRGGVAANTVADFAEAVVDLRARDPDSFAETGRRIRALAEDVKVSSAADGFPCSIQVREMPAYPPMPPNEGGRRLADLARECGGRLGLTLEDQDRGGASDANHLYTLVPTLDGLGPVGDNAHCSQRSEDGTKDQEYVIRSSIADRALLSMLLFQDLVAPNT